MGNLTAVTRPGHTAPDLQYVVDGIAKKVAGVITKRYLWQSPLQLAAEYDGAGTLIARYVYGTKVNVPEYMIRDGQTYRLVTDHLGSVRMVVNVNTGVVAQRIDYDEFGKATLVTGTWDVQPFGFAGGLYDPDTGLVRFGARDYDAETGRWTAKDPILFKGGDTNLFGYVVGDPINLLDPSGRDPLTNWWTPMHWDPANLAGAALTIANVFTPNATTSWSWNGGDPVILLQNSPWTFGNWGLTMGHVVVIAPLDPGDAKTTMTHELSHVRQHDYLGLFYLPLNLLGGVCSMATTPDRSSDDNNPFEVGPLKSETTNDPTAF